MIPKTTYKFGQVNSVFTKLILSYSIVVIIVTVILGVVSYLFFASRYNREIEKVHQKVLEQVADSLEFQMMQPVTRCFLDLSTDYSDESTNLLHFTDSVNRNNYKIYQTYDYLKQVASLHSGMINAIHIYYKNQNLIISSSSGIVLNPKSQNNYKKPDWFDTVDLSSKRSVWLEPRKAYFDPNHSRYRGTRTNVFTFLRTYPMISTGADCEGLIAIDISEDTISNLIQKAIPSEYQNTFIINDQGLLISHPQKEFLFKKLDQESYIRRIITSPLSYDSFIKKVDHKRSMITFTSLPNTEWKIVNIIPIDQFYQSTRFIQLLLIVICLLAIVIGLMLSFGFTRQIYNPLDSIIQKVRLLAGVSNGALKGNEYGFINQFIDDIAGTIQSFRETEPVIKNDFIMGLLYHRFFSEREMAEKSKLLDQTMNYDYYYVMLLRLNEAAIKDLTLEESQGIKHQFNLEIQNNNEEAGKCLAVDLNDFQIGVIIGVKEPDSDFINEFAERMASFAIVKYNLPIAATVGSRVGSWLEIHQSFKEAILLQKYHYYYPHPFLIRGETFLNKEHSHELLPDLLVADFSEGLRLRDLEQVDRTLFQLITMIMEGDYSADHCQQEVLEITHAFSVYLKNMRYILSESEKFGLENLFTATGDIQGFKVWICEFAEKVFRWVEIRTGNHNYQIIERVTQYIANHLDTDFSLETVAEMVNLSPSYFSKIFKEVMGVAFSAYLTDLRLEKAYELLLQTDLSVQEIGYKVGYNAPAYFIKQFKAKSGYTPYDYRRQFQNRALLQEQLD